MVHCGKNRSVIQCFTDSKARIRIEGGFCYAENDNGG